MENNLAVKWNGGECSQEQNLAVFNDPELDGPEVIQAETDAEPGGDEKREEEWIEAMSLLRDPDLIDIFLEDIDSAGCVGDEEFFHKHRRKRIPNGTHHRGPEAKIQGRSGSSGTTRRFIRTMENNSGVVEGISGGNTLRGGNQFPCQSHKDKKGPC